MRLNNDRGVGMGGIGLYNVDVNNGAWTDVDITAFTSLTATALNPGSRIVDVSLRNTHATQIIYIMLKYSGAEAVTAGIPVGAGETLNIDGLLLADDGAQTYAVSVQGSGANTTGTLICGFQSGDY